MYSTDPVYNEAITLFLMFITGLIFMFYIGSLLRDICREWKRIYDNN
jgi:hypothetical protein